MTSFDTFVSNNSAKEARESNVLCRMWQRQGGFTSGSTLSKEGKTYWISKGEKGYALFEGSGINRPLHEAVAIADLKESQTTSKDGEVIPVLRGSAFLNNKAVSIVVRANTLHEKQEQVKKAEAKRLAEQPNAKPALLSNQPDVYVMIESFKLDGRVEKKPESKPAGVEELPF